MITSYLTSEGKRVGNYLLEREIGSGQFGKIYLAKNITNGHIYAVKQIDREKVESNNTLQRLLRTEISIMRDIKHPNILHLHENLQSTNNFYLVLDYCNQGDFHTYMNKKGSDHLDERTAVFYLRQVANGFQELRKHKILHRDIKLQNFFVKNDVLIIGDFGFAKRGTEMAQTKLGTPYTMAYELLDEHSTGNYDSRADLWSVGVVYYEMLFGHMPFQGDDYAALRKDILKKANGNLNYPFEVSYESKDLFNKILVTNPNKRMRWEEFFHHPLFDKFTSQIDNDAQNINRAFGQPLVDQKSNVEALFNVNKLNFTFSGNNNNFPVDTKNTNKGDFNNPEFLNWEGLLKYADEKKWDPVFVDEDFFSVNSNNDYQKQLEMKEMHFRYTHEEGLVRYYVYSIKKIQKVIKDGLFNNMSNEFFDAIILLFKKAILVNTINMDSLLYNNNIYGYNQTSFNQFKNSQDFQNLLSMFSSLKNSLSGYVNLTIQRMDELKIQPRFYNMLKEDFRDINFINEQLRKLLQHLRQKASTLVTNEGALRDFYYVLAVVRFAHESDMRFPYMKDINNTFSRFSWDGFYQSFDNLTVNDLRKIV